MSENAATLNAAANTSGWRDRSPAAASRTHGWVLRLCVPAAAVILSGSFLLASLFALQVAALEVCDRLNIFPLYGLLFINLLCGLLLTYYVVKSRKPAYIGKQADEPAQEAAVRSRLSGLRAGVSGFLNISRAGARTPMKARPAAVLLIIKRRTTAGTEAENRVA